MKTLLKKHKKSFKTWLAGSMAFVTTSMYGVVVSATTAGDTTQESQFISTILKEVYKTISGNFTLLAVVSACISLALILFGGSGRAAEGSLKALKIIVIVWIAFSLLGAIVKYGDKLLSPFGFGDVYNIN